MTKKEIIENSIINLGYADICDIEERVIVSFKNLVVTKTNNVTSIDFAIYSYNTKVATLYLTNAASREWIVNLRKNVFWSNTTKRDVLIVADALLDRIGNNARIGIYTKNGVMNASSTDESKIKIIIE